MEYIIGYYVFVFQQYFIHKIQHNSKMYKTHIVQHHNTYDVNDITKEIHSNTLYQNLDLYFYGKIIFIFVNACFLNINIILFQFFLLYIQYYFHSEYHVRNSVWEKHSFFKYLKRKHEIHHKYPNKNHFLLDPTCDLIFNTYK